MLISKLLILIALIPAALGGAIPTAPKGGDVIPGQYIVVLKEDITTSGFRAHQDFVVNKATASMFKRGEEASAETIFTHTYNLGGLKGYAGRFDDATIEEIASRPEVSYVEADKIATTQALTTQNSVPSWGLARISHRNKRFTTTYVYDTSAGSGTFAYILDTGVLETHTEFGGRASAGYNAISGENATDGNGHGTHVAGTIAGSTFGIAKSASVIGVKVLDTSGSGAISGIIAGIQWVVSDAQSKRRVGRAVANMSLGGSYSASLNNACASAVRNGIPFIVAAGNSNQNAANFSPASTRSAITVGATDSTDARASYSNFGASLDFFAPGSSITSAWIGISNSASNTISGTSMASPHVAGLAAYLMALEGITTPDSVVRRITGLSSTGLVTRPGIGSPNRLIYNGSNQ